MQLNKALLHFIVNQAVNLICFRQHGCATLFESDMFESLKWLTAYLRLFAPTRCEHWEDKRELSSPCVWFLAVGDEGFFAKVSDRL